MTATTRSTQPTKKFRQQRHSRVRKIHHPNHRNSQATHTQLTHQQRLPGQGRSSWTPWKTGERDTVVDAHPDLLSSGQREIQGGVLAHHSNTTEPPAPPGARRKEEPLTVRPDAPEAPKSGEQECAGPTLGPQDGHSEPITEPEITQTPRKREAESSVGLEAAAAAGQIGLSHEEDARPSAIDGALVGGNCLHAM